MTRRQQSRGAQGNAVRVPAPKVRKKTVRRADSDLEPTFDVKRFLRPVLFWGLRLVLLAGVGGSGYLLWPYVNQPVTEVELTGELARVNQSRLRKRVQENISGGLLTMDMASLDSAVQELDWVYRAEIKKRWPQRLVVNVIEERPVARWGEIGYLAESGMLVKSPLFSDLDDLPVFDVQVNAPHRTLEIFYDIYAAMMVTGVGIRELRQSEFGSWSMVMENGSHIILGKENLMTRMHRVIHTWQRLSAEHINELEAIDARYSNGVAVKYRQQLVHDKPRIDGDEKT